MDSSLGLPDSVGRYRTPAATQTGRPNGGDIGRLGANSSVRRRLDPRHEQGEAHRLRRFETYRSLPACTILSAKAGPCLLFVLN